MPVISEFTSESMAQILESSTSAGIPVLVLFRTGEQTEGDIALEKEVNKFSKLHKGRVICAVSSKSSRDNAFRLLQQMLSLDDAAYPTVRLMAKNPSATNRNSAILKYRLAEGEHPTVASMTNLLQGFEAGTLSQYIRSEPVPKEEDLDPYDPVKVIVGSTLGDYIRQRKKNIFLNFYAPWCGHCKRLQPVWKELGVRLRGNEDLVEIAQLDATANEVADVEIRGYPTIHLYPMDDSGSTRPIEYGGYRTSDAFIEWLNKQIKGGQISLDTSKSAQQQLRLGQEDNAGDAAIESDTSGYNAGKGHSSDEM